MDIENLRKIQETEKMLRMHSISTSTQDAITSIGQDVFVGGTRIPSMNEVHESSSQQLMDAKVEAYQQSIQQKNEVSTMDSQMAQQLKKEINEQGELIGRQAQLIHQLQGVVNDVIREINKMQTSVATKNPAERQQVLKAEEKTEHPRSAGVNPSDVTVEKFFNFSGTR
ncbi:MAG TPA: hypothetical protein VKE88_01170 [Candidatus Nanoarchaeia archaeon]|nr:hypothetical protein [Candidatus Nanoarchaeia archaeon]